MVKCAFPVIFNQFWYFTAFFALFFAIPLLNKFIFSISESQAKAAFLILIGLFSLTTVLSDPFETQYGYSAIWLMVLYCIGALAKKIKLFESRKTVSLIVLWVLCALLTWAVYVFFNTGRLLRYSSPTILLCGMILVVLFSRLRLKGKIIAKISPLAFGVYLLQLNPVIWKSIIKDSFAFIAAEPLALGVLYFFAFASVIFIAGLAVEFLRSKAAGLLRIPQLSRKIVSLFDFVLVKLSVLLK